MATLPNYPEVKYVKIDAATNGDNSIVAAVAAKSIRVLSYVLVSAGTVTVRFESAAGGTALTGQMTMAVNTTHAAAFSPVGHFQTIAGEALNLELSGAVSVDGFLVYELV